MADDARSIVTLTTDFGASDPYVAAMKGVMLSINPHLTIVDVSHDVRPQQVRQAAFITQCAWPFFPPRAVHVAVVDPGVGTERLALVLETPRGLFVGPDNGVLSAALSEDVREGVAGGERIALPPGYRAYAISNRALMHEPVSATFHGRDVFAPAAAHLARGHPFPQVGPLVDDPVRPLLPRARPEPGPAVRGRVMWVDRFGNLITNVDAAALTALGEQDGAALVVDVGGRPPAPVVSHYGAVAAGEVAAVVGSSGHLELFANQGSAAEILGAGTGSPVRVRPGMRSPGPAQAPGARTRR